MHTAEQLDVNTILALPNNPQVALKYYQPSQVLVQNTPSGKQYVFVVQANISMAYVDADDVDNLLSRKAGCNCGGNKKQAFYRANEDDVRRWENKGGR